MTCSYGNWLNDYPKNTINTFASCQASPCILPEIENGFYITNGYKEGMSISHGSSIDYSCHDGFIKRSDSYALRCSEAHLIPFNPICISSSIITDGVTIHPSMNIQNETNEKIKSNTQQNNLILTIDADSRINQSVYTSQDEVEERISNFIAATDIELLNQLNSIQDETVAKWKSDERKEHTKVTQSTITTSSTISWCSSPEGIEDALRFTGSYTFPPIVKEGKNSHLTSLDDDGEVFRYTSSLTSSHSSPSYMTSVPVSSQLSSFVSPLTSDGKEISTSIHSNTIPSSHEQSNVLYESSRSPIIYSLEATTSLMSKRSVTPVGEIDKMLQKNLALDTNDGNEREKDRKKVSSFIDGSNSDLLRSKERITRRTSHYESRYPIGSEFIFKCIPESPTSLSKKATWKIKCDEKLGWIGSSFPCLLDEREINMDTDDSLLSKESINNCTYTVDEDEGKESILYAFYRDTLIMNSIVVTSGQMVTFRCSDIGKYALQGSSVISCFNGSWNDSLPTCEGLSQQYDYALEKAPTILFRHSNGSIAQSTSSTLVVTPGTNLHLECLWIRKFGDPTWEYVTLKTQQNASATYQQGWTSEVSRDSGLEYRLSIVSASSSDSGVYTCVTPVKHRHSVVIEVKSIWCPVFHPSELSKSLQVNYWSTDVSGKRIDYTISAPMIYTFKIPMNGKVDVSCPPGMSLDDAIKSNDIICLPSGRWSSKLPQCTPTLCANLTNITSTLTGDSITDSTDQSSSKGHSLQVPRNNITLNVAVVSFNITGINETMSHNKSWTWPSISINGRTVGSRATFSCPRGFALNGLDELTCMSDGHWSSSLPKCIETLCPSPPVIVNGFIVPEDIKDLYHFQDLITYNCLDGFILRGGPMLFCQENGQWSTRQPICEVA